ncbi:alpha/beta fold hydrolase [Streptomyces sp. JHA26]|uniref:alpha/beta fold hydrolase n=1 Tax=Streptomyces sp. JHA26 TaxID=1917143 RepID=UPI00098B0869|nr:alpha/beta hydrolase [Streptomyces sp. JHA26]
MPTVSTSDSVVEYFVTGTGTGLALVHGTGGDAAGYEHLLKKFDDRRTVITPNYSGSGATKDNGAPLTLDLLAEQVVAAVEDSPAEGPVDLVGWSLGAVVAAKIAADRPELVRRLVLLTGWASLDERQRLFFDMWHRLDQLDHETFGRFLQLHGWTDEQLNVLGTKGVEELVSGGIPAGIGRQIALNLTTDITGLLPKITAPTLVIGAKHDRMVPVRHSRELHASIAGSTYVEMEAGHFALFEKPDELAEIINGFIHQDADEASAA